MLPYADAAIRHAASCLPLIDFLMRCFRAARAARCYFRYAFAATPMRAMICRLSIMLLLFFATLYFRAAAIMLIIYADDIFCWRRSRVYATVTSPPLLLMMLRFHTLADAGLLPLRLRHAFDDAVATRFYFADARRRHAFIIDVDCCRCCHFRYC